MCLIYPLDLTDSYREEPLEVKINPDFPDPPRPNLSKFSMIPTEIVRDIILTYEFGKLEDLPKLPNNLICLIGGSFWTTWDYVISLRELVAEIKAKKP